MVYSGKEHLEQLLENANLEKSDLKASSEKTRQELEAKIQELKKEEVMVGMSIMWFHEVSVLLSCRQQIT